MSLTKRDALRESFVKVAWPPIYANSRRKQQELERERGPIGVASSSVRSTAGVRRSGDMTQQVLLGTLWLSASD